MEFVRIGLAAIFLVLGVFFVIRYHRNKKRLQKITHMKQELLQQAQAQKQRKLVKSEGKELIHKYIQLLQSKQTETQLSFRELFSQDHFSPRDIEHLEKVFYTDVPLDKKIAKTIKEHTTRF